MKNRNILPIDVSTGEVVPGITMQDGDDRKRAREYWAGWAPSPLSAGITILGADSI